MDLLCLYNYPSDSCRLLDEPSFHLPTQAKIPQHTIADVFQTSDHCGRLHLDILQFSHPSAVERLQAGQCVK